MKHAAHGDTGIGSKTGSGRHGNEKMKTRRALLSVAMVFALMAVPGQVLAATADDYCIIPSFMKVIQPPNLLLMIDNSSSMYDIAYADEGQKDAAGAITRQPYYCYDQTYKSGTTYAGYFDNADYYEYDFDNDYFYKIETFPLAPACGKYVANTLCVDFDTATPAQVDKFAAKGNYLNWLSASKFDIEKEVLTGGKYDGPSQSLIAESRGCIGQPFIKEALTQDFENFSSETNPNNVRKLGVVFAVKGPPDSVNPSAPSRGGQTFIEIYDGTYNNEACQNAVDLYLASATTSQPVVSDAIAQCINYTTSNSSYCQLDNTISCTTDANCIVVNDGVLGACRNKDTISCYYDTDCFQGNSYKGPCDGESVAGTVNKGPCINPTHSAEVKTKIAYSETIQSCWSYLRNGNLTTGDFNRLTTGGKCNDVYAGAGVCSADTSKACTVDTDCSASGWGTCTKGPSAILPGNPAQVCSSEYLGAYYTGSSPAWSNTWANNDAGMIDAVRRFCNASQPTVIDPTDSAATSVNYETVPAILGGIGLEGQLGTNRGKMTAKVRVPAEPEGIVQQFSNRIRIGAMKFNFSGSASEVPPASGATIIAPKVCSNDPTRLCILDVDCGANNTCDPTTAGTTNLDGGRIIHAIGKGLCATMTVNACTVDGDCASGQTCINKVCAGRKIPPNAPPTRTAPVPPCVSAAVWATTKAGSFRH
jgi:type IV pilus assembly protein PilY1